MKRAAIVGVAVLLAIVWTVTVFARQVPDLTGTWIGDTDFPGTPEKDHVALVLKKEGTSYSGTISIGKTKDAPLEKLTFQDEDSFTFEFTMGSGNDTIKISAKLDFTTDKILGNKLMGGWSMDSGEYGLLELELKK